MRKALAAKVATEPPMQKPTTPCRVSGTADSRRKLNAASRSARMPSAVSAAMIGLIGSKSS